MFKKRQWEKAIKESNEKKKAKYLEKKVIEALKDEI